MTVKISKMVSLPNRERIKRRSNKKREREIKTRMVMMKVRLMRKNRIRKKFLLVRLVPRYRTQRI
jgi:hypothetical protein